MKTLIQISQALYQLKPSFSGRMLSMIAFICITSGLYGQVDCEVTMACNDGIQVSLDENCIAVITPDMMLEDQDYDDSFYEVTVMDLEGNDLPSNILDNSHKGQSFNVQVALIGCPVSCWGMITIEDKLPPFVENCNDVIVECEDDLTPGGPNVPLPSATDACSSVTFEFNETSESNACANDFIKTIFREYTFTDDDGNESSCTQTILVRKAGIADVVFPPNYDDIDQPAFECAVTLETLPNGAPDPSETGYPTGAACGNIQVYYTDLIFDLCGASLKVLRQWVVIDWCTGEEISGNQIIKILDTKAPICSANEDFMNEIYTDEGECTGTFEVPPPIVIFECSDYSYTVGYKLRDENGDPFEDPIYDNVSYNPATGLFTITGLPQDTSWIVYTITDACGHSTMCFTEVLVLDNEAPTPVCEGYTVVGLEDAGWADIFALSIDDGSEDNCEIVKYEVRRQTTSCGFSSDLQFGEKVNFCCADVGSGYIKVELRVTDQSGNSNICVVNVTVQDKINPTIECPSNTFIHCEQDYNDFSLTGYAVGYDNCNVTITHSDNASLNDCGIGTVVRSFVATDNQGRTATCTQVITVGDNTPFNENNINWPNDLEANGCDGSVATPEELNSFPILSNTGCADIAVSYDDNVFYNTPEYCIKILRHWKIVDWCNYDPQNPSFYEYTQLIGITNSNVPTFDSCDGDVTVVSDDGDCVEQATVSVSATDDCTPSTQLKYSYQLDLNSNGSIDHTGVTNLLTRTFESGTHIIYWTVEDACGNVSTCNNTVTVEDTKAPTPICLGSITYGINEDGQAEIWAIDFNLKSEDGCTEEDDLRYTFTSTPPELDPNYHPSLMSSSMDFTCNDVPNGIAEEIELDMYVWDTDGNTEFCSVIMILQDSELNNACVDSEGVGTLAGRVINTLNVEMSGIEVELMDMDAQEANMDMTTDLGEYAFNDVTFYGDYALEPYKNDDIKNGVSTLDLVMIQRHILELDIIESPYTLIAADITGNDKISSSDLLSLRKVILGVKSEFTGNTSWRFIPTTYEIEDPEHPWGFPEKVIIDEMYLDQMHIDFTAIKIGDINGNASNLKGNKSEVRSAPIALKIEDQQFKTGEKVSIPVYANEVSNLVGMQLAVNFDQSIMTYGGLKSGVLNMTNDNVNSSNGLLTISWNEVLAAQLKSTDVLFYLEFIADADGSVGNVLSLSDKEIAAEAYDEQLNISPLTLDVEARDIEIYASTKLYQNTPNPFRGMTSIGFDLESASIATITIYDIAGKELYRITNEFEKGYNQLSIDVASLGVNSGVLYYQLKAGTFVEGKKMIVLK